MGALIYFSPRSELGAGAETIDGWIVPGTGGGPDGSNVGLDVDFRTLDALDLNGNLITFVDQGVTWSSPAAIDPATNSWAIVPGQGLVGSVGANTRFTNTAQDAPHVWTREQDIPGWSSAVEALVMIEFADLVVTSNTELVFVGNYAPAGDSGPASRVPFSDARAISNGLGFANGSADTVRLLEGLATTAFVGVAATTNVLAMRYVSGAALQFLVGETTAGGDWPAPGALRDIGPFLAAANNAFEDEMWTNEAFNRIAFGLNQENLGPAMSGRIPRARIMLR